MNLTAEDRKALQGAVRVLVEILQQSPDETPDIIKQWPTDDKHLRGEFWKDRDGDHWRYRNDMWQIWDPAKREWSDWGVSNAPGHYPPFTRTTDPSLPRTWDTLDDVPEDVELITGDYVGIRRELARGELSGSGWFQRVLDNAPRRWAELPAAEVRNFTNIREEQ